MPRKAKKKIHPMPPLSFVDQCIYWLGFILMMAFNIGIWVVHSHMRRAIAFSDESVLASGEATGIVWIFLPFFVTFAITLALWATAYSGRRPIFGLKNFRYGPPGWPRVYPLFMRNKPVGKADAQERKMRKAMAWILAAVLLGVWLLFPMSLYGRSCLHWDGSIVQYNVFNQEKRHFSAGQMESVEIEAYLYRSGRARHKHWGVRVILTTDTGKEYSYPIGTFREDGQVDTACWLTDMIQLKKRYDPAVIHIKGIENLGKVIEDNHLSQEEVALLYQLFALQ